MSGRRRLLGMAFVVVAAACVAILQSSTRAYTFHRQDVLGTSFDLTVRARSLDAAERAERAALDRISADARVLSSYDPSSEFSRWSRTADEPVSVSEQLFDVLQLFDEWRSRTEGAINPAAEVATRVWKNAAAAGQLPEPAELFAAASAAGRTHWALDAVRRTATRLGDVPLAMNSFTKSYIIDRAARAALAESGARALMLNIGGDLVVRGDWTADVAIADPASDAENGDPVTTVQVADRAVATSGGYRRGVDIGGHHYSHLIDPRTGRPVDHVRSATVIAPDAATAGALATAFCVLSPSQSRALAATLPGVEFLILEHDGGRLQSPGWRALEAPGEPSRSFVAMPTAYAAQPGSWDSSYELTIALEIARQEGFGARRPYVAVWIEDADRFAVRTLALWFEKPRWLADLKSWYRADRMRALAEGTELVSTVSSATRSPGRYTLKWDGRDNQGKLVKSGTYTVCIEAAREHGTYQIIRQEIALSGVAKQLTVPGNVEIASASLDYHKLATR